MVSSLIKKITYFAIGIYFLSGSLATASEHFPEYEVIKPNVTFWEQVYSKYNTTQGIVHDCIQPHIIYEIIKLEPEYARDAHRINKKRMKKAKKHYQSILKRLAANSKVTDAESREIALLFGPKAKSRDFRKASYRIRCQVGQRDRFEKGLIRSGAYIDQIREIFKAHGLPEDLAYLPHVESSFNTKAYSKSGAAGIWQFTRSTGKRFMAIDYEIDERRDPIIASHAAAELLKKNYEKLGSWPLAITAYNHGATGMKRAKRRHGSYPVIFQSYRSRTFKFASRNFYSEFIAARNVASRYTDYFGELEFERPQLTYTVKLAGFVSFEDLCSHFKITPKRLRELNPSLSKTVYKEQKFIPKGYTLKLPGLQQGPTMKVANVPLSLYRAKQKPTTVHIVRRGDTAAKIAKVYGISIKDLILANNLSRRARIYPKQTLRIPQPGTSGRPSQEEQAMVMLAQLPKPKPDYFEPVSEEMSKQIPSSEAMTVQINIKNTRNHHGKTIGIIRVEVEETLGHYAEWAGVSTRQIRRLNNMSHKNHVRLNQKLKIPLHRVTGQGFEQNRYEYHKRMRDDFFAEYKISSLQHYRIRRGDNYWKLCFDKFEIPMWLMQHCNPEIDFGSLHVHKRLKVPMLEKHSDA